MSWSTTTTTAPGRTVTAAPTTARAPVTAPAGTGLITIPGGGQPGVSQPSGQPSVPGPGNDGSDFYGLAVAVILIVGAIFVVRRLVPVRRATFEAERRGQRAYRPDDEQAGAASAEAPEQAGAASAEAPPEQAGAASAEAPLGREGVDPAGTGDPAP